jgi:hypothetical protein
MSIEQEAEAFMSGKQQAFKDGLEAGCDNLTKYLKDNLWHSHELERTLDKLTEVELWALRTAENYGIK